MSSLLDGLQKKYVVIVDELDRCRPEFTIMFLEAVKHFFDKKNLMFIFMINRSQLEKVIHHRYGYGSDENYLNKFFKLNMGLPNLKNTSDITPAEYILEKLNSNSLIDSKLVEKIDDTNKSLQANITRAIYSIITEVIENLDYSLRDMDEIIKYITLYSILEGKQKVNDYCELLILVLSTVILKSAPDLSVKIITSLDKIIKEDNMELKKSLILISQRIIV